MRESYLAAVERNVECAPGFVSEPYEAAWAGEAIWFIRILDEERPRGDMVFGVDLSPDGMHWIAEGTTCRLASAMPLAFLRVSRFGAWLRLRRLDTDGGTARVLVYLNLKQ